MSRQQRLTLLAAICGSAVATIDGAIVQVARHYGAYDIRSLAQAVNAAGARAALAASEQSPSGGLVLVGEVGRPRDLQAPSRRGRPCTTAGKDRG
jgi:hypothetical protein